MQCKKCGAFAEITYADCQHQENFCPNCGFNLNKEPNNKLFQILENYKFHVKCLTQDEKDKEELKLKKYVRALT